jgi:predicted NUDIX family NTP pyrophosphohydrolase
VPATLSAGVLLFRRSTPELEVLLAHPGGPFWARKDYGAWTIPKGLYEPDVDTDPLATAIREFTEEVGTLPPGDQFIDLGQVRLASGKKILAWALEGDLDPATARSATFEMQWPPRSGQMTEFPEVDRVEWFSVDAARPKLNKAQLPLLDRLLAAVERIA